MSGVLLLLLVSGFIFQIAIIIVRLRQLPGDTALDLVLAIAAYLLQGAIGINALIYCQPFLSHTSTAAVGAVAALFGWFALGLHGLFALTPTTGDTSKPRWMTRLGIYDVVCLLVIGCGIAAAVL
jgi:heme A synthase